jgi:hypothetical protein
MLCGREEEVAQASIPAKPPRRQRPDKITTAVTTLFAGWMLKYQTKLIKSNMAHFLCAGGGQQVAAAAGSTSTQAGSSTAGPAGVGGDDPLVAAALAAAEVKLLTRKLAAADKQIAALKDVFNKRVKAFRDSVR